MKEQKYLSPSQVRRYAKVDRVTIAREVGCSPKWVREILNGRELITGEAAQKILKHAEKLSAQ